jgi:hypothetical protein
MFKVDSENGIDWYRVVVTQYIPAKIIEVETDLDEEEAEDHAAKLTIECYWLENVRDVVSPVRSGSIVLYDDEIPGYDEATYVEDAVLAVAVDYTSLYYNDYEIDLGYAEILDSYVMEEAVSGTVTKVKSKKITIDGEVYELNENYAPVDENYPIKSKNDYTLYDYNGFVLASEKVAEEDNTQYGILLATSNKEDDWGDVTSKVKIFTAEGDEAQITVDSDYDDYPYATTLIKDGEILVAYEVNEDGELTAIKPVDDLKTPKYGQKMKTGGVLYGKQVNEEVVAFANIADPGDDAEWTVYDYDDLADADEVVVIAWEMNDDGVAAMKIGSLEDVDTVLGFITDVESVQNEDGDWVYDVTAFVDGKEVTYTTKKGVDVPIIDGPVALAKFTVDGYTAKAIEPAVCVGVDDAGVEFDKEDAHFYGSGPFVYDEGDFIFQVVDKNGQTLDVGRSGDIDNQIVAKGANVYSLSYDEGSLALDTSSYGKVKKGCAVVLMQLDEDSTEDGVWDTVIYSTSYVEPE